MFKYTIALTFAVAQAVKVDQSIAEELGSSLIVWPEDSGFEVNFGLMGADLMVNDNASGFVAVQSANVEDAEDAEVVVEEATPEVNESDN